jgi:hypothetical protein
MAEDYDGAALPPIYAPPDGTHAIPDFNVDPGAINTPIIFEMPAAADPTASTAMLYAAVSRRRELRRLRRLRFDRRRDLHSWRTR